MLTFEGKIYFFSCHALHGSLQVYYNYLSHNQLQHWHRDYEEIVSWIAEEIVYPAENENLGQQSDLMLQNAGEVVGDSTYNIFENQSLAKQRNFSIHLSYLEYCQWLIRVLDKFEKFMLSQQLSDSVYQKRFLLSANMFNTLQDVVHSAIKTTQTSANQQIIDEIKVSANRMADNWTDQVNETVKNFTS